MSSTGIEAAFAEIYADRSLAQDASNRGPVKCKRVNWWDFKPVMDYCKKRYGSAHGAHATPSEVAVTYFLHPQAIKDVEMAPKVAPWGRYTDAESYRAAFPDGRIGSDPSLADPKDGEQLIALSVEGLIDDFRKFEAG
ncbi:MAG: creatininase family protein [Parvibaculum sp.]|nr:creatininase family protein [Parvibaculum sp.]